MKTSYRIVESRLVETVCEGDHMTIIGKVVNRPQEAADAITYLIGNATKEHFVTVLLDAKHRIIGFDFVSVGTLTSSIVHPREVFGPALRLNAAAIIVAHNHPSGDLTPSVEDEAVTKRLKEAGSLLGVPVLDHLIVNADGEHRSV